jgi:hypothetical protein
MQRSAQTYPNDLFTDDVLADPYAHYAALRELGPVVWLEAHNMYVLPRWAEARAALFDAATFCSGKGVAMNDVMKASDRETTTSSGAEFAVGSVIVSAGVVGESAVGVESLTTATLLLVEVHAATPMPPAPIRSTPTAPTCARRRVLRRRAPRRARTSDATPARSSGSATRRAAVPNCSLNRSSLRLLHCRCDRRSQ